MQDSIAVEELALLLPLKEAQQEVFVPKGATVHKVQKLLSPALWGNTVEPKETKNQMTVSRVTLVSTVLETPTLSPQVHVHQAITAQEEHPYQPSMSRPRVTSQVRLLFFHASVQLELIRRLIEPSVVQIVRRKISVMKWVLYFRRHA